MAAAALRRAAFGCSRFTFYVDRRLGQAEWQHAAHKFGLASPRADVTDVAGVAVARIADGASFLFIEAGARNR